MLINNMKFIFSDRYKTFFTVCYFTELIEPTIYLDIINIVDHDLLNDVNFTQIHINF